MLSHMKRAVISTVLRSIRRTKVTTVTSAEDEAGNSPINVISDKKNVERRASKTNKFNEYVKNLSFLKKPIASSGSDYAWSTEYMRIKNGAQVSLYLVDEGVGEEIKRLIQSHHLKLDIDATVIEINPGFGVLTSVLSKCFGFSHINCFEDDKDLANRLAQKFSVNAVLFNLFSLSRIHYADKMDGESRVTTLFSKLKRGNTKLYIFGATDTSDFLNFIIRTLVTHRVIFEEDFSWSDIYFYMAMGSKTINVFTSSPASLYTTYRPSSILFQTLFHCDVMGTLPRKAFVPWQRSDGSHEITDPSEKYKKIRVAFDPEKMHLLHFRPNMEAIDKVGRDHLFQFWYFVRHNLYSRKNPVIPLLERWIPGCGQRLIPQGFTIFTEFGSLTPPQILDLYLQFTSWPEYPSSSFLTAVDKFQSKIESNEDDVDFKPIF